MDTVNNNNNEFVRQVAEQLETVKGKNSEKAGSTRSPACTR